MYPAHKFYGVSRRDVVKDLEDFRDKWRHYNEQAAAESQVILDKISELFEKDDEAYDALDLYDIDYDLDDGDRIMVDDSLYDDALDAFDEYDIEYEEV